MNFDLTDQFQRSAFADKIKADIDEFCRVHYDDGHRHHLGASIIGEECSRRLYYTFRWAKQEEFEGRMQRLFNRGHQTEPRFIAWLEAVGFTVYPIDPETDDQFRISDCGGHFGGSLDSEATHPDYPGIRFMPEYKTYNTKGFLSLVNDKVKLKSPKHWAQMCSYGYKRGIKYAIYCAINKNDDDLHIEVLELDWNYGQDCVLKAETIIRATEPPPRISDNPAFFKCTYCPFKEPCHEGAAVDRNCRSCRHSKPIDGAQWYCNRWKGVIPRDKYVEAAAKCGDYFSI